MTINFSQEIHSLFDRVINSSDCPKKQIKIDIISLVLLSLTVKVLITIITTDIFHTFIDMYDLSIYLSYAKNIISNGLIPYVNFPVEYPQLFFIPVLLAMIPAWFLNNSIVFILSFQGLMVLFDLFTGIFVYFIAMKLYGRQFAWLSGIMYATAFGSAYFTLTKYDAFAVFVLMLSIFLFIYRVNLGAYLTSVVGFLIKWFPGLVLPYYIIYDLKNNERPDKIKRNIFYAFILFLLIILPFLLMNLNGFLNTYLFHISRSPQASSFVYFLDFSFYNLIGVAFVSKVSFLICVLLELLLLYIFYRSKSVSEKDLLVYISLSLFVFIITNPIFSPQYLLWLTPFLALFLVSSLYKRILFYAAQVLLYLEFPVLFNVLWDNGKFIIKGTSLFLSPSYIFFTLKFMVLFLILFSFITSLNNRNENQNINKNFVQISQNGKKRG